MQLSSIALASLSTRTWCRACPSRLCTDCLRVGSKHFPDCCCCYCCCCCCAAVQRQCLTIDQWCRYPGKAARQSSSCSLTPVSLLKPPKLTFRSDCMLGAGKMIALARCNKTTSRVLLHAVMANSRRILLSDPCLFRPWSQVSNEAKDMLHRWAHAAFGCFVV